MAKPETLSGAEPLLVRVTACDGLTVPLGTGDAADPNVRLAGLRLAVGAFSSTETSLEAPSATARSGLPSPFRSPIATEMGWLWAPKLTAELKESVFELTVVFSNTETSAVPALATARSGLPSPFMSPMATDSGRLWAPKFA